MNTEELPLNNQYLLERFNYLKDEYFRLENLHGIQEGISKKVIENRSLKWHTEDEYLNDMITRGDHGGFPETYNSIVISDLAEMGHPDWSQYRNECKTETAELMGAHTSALSLYYPPGGFVGWHTNQNASSYQILFTWSETGEGYFRYKDTHTGEIDTLNDKVGWNVRYHYFGGDTDPEHILWHAAYTECPRFSFAFKFAFKDNNNSLFEMALDEIKTH